MSGFTWTIILLGYSQIIPIMLVLSFDESTSTASRHCLPIMPILTVCKTTRQSFHLHPHIPFALDAAGNSQSLTVSKIMSRIMSCQKFHLRLDIARTHFTDITLALLASNFPVGEDIVVKMNQVSNSTTHNVGLPRFVDS